MFLLWLGLLPAVAAFSGPVPALQALWGPPNSSVVLPDRAWLGGDSDWSIDLGNGSVLWLYGDTLVGGYDAEAMQRIGQGAAMPHGTIGRVDLGAAATNAFFWNTSAAGTPVPWFVPLSPPPVFNGSTGNGDDYLWTTTGLNWSNGLILLGPRIRNAGSGPFGFATVSSMVVHVPDASGPPSRWRYSTCDLWPTGQEHGVLWHSAVSAAGSDEAYVLGQLLHSTDDTSAVVLRIGLQALAACELHQSLGWNGSSWVPYSQASLAGLWAPSVPETTVTPIPSCASDSGFFSLFIDFAGPLVKVRTAPAITGPWTARPDLAVSIPLPLSNSSLGFCYAPKAHPSLDGAFSAGCSSVFSFVCNTWSLGALFEPHAMEWYIPRFWSLEWPR
jgi:hypothetical protein